MVCVWDTETGLLLHKSTGMNSSATTHASITYYYKPPQLSCGRDGVDGAILFARFSLNEKTDKTTRQGSLPSSRLHMGSGWVKVNGERILCIPPEYGQFHAFAPPFMILSTPLEGFVFLQLPGLHS